MPAKKETKRMMMVSNKGWLVSLMQRIKEKVKYRQDHDLDDEGNIDSAGVATKGIARDVMIIKIANSVGELYSIVAQLLLWYLVRKPSSHLVKNRAEMEIAPAWKGRLLVTLNLFSYHELSEEERALVLEYYRDILHHVMHREVVGKKMKAEQQPAISPAQLAEEALVLTVIQRVLSYTQRVYKEYQKLYDGDESTTLGRAGLVVGDVIAISQTLFQTSSQATAAALDLELLLSSRQLLNTVLDQLSSQLSPQSLHNTRHRIGIGSGHALLAELSGLHLAVMNKKAVKIAISQQRSRAQQQLMAEKFERQMMNVMFLNHTGFKVNRLLVDDQLTLLFGLSTVINALIGLKKMQLAPHSQQKPRLQELVKEYADFLVMIVKQYFERNKEQLEAMFVAAVSYQKLSLQPLHAALSHILSCLQILQDVCSLYDHFGLHQLAVELCKFTLFAYRDISELVYNRELADKYRPWFTVIDAFFGEMDEDEELVKEKATKKKKKEKKKRNERKVEMVLDDFYSTEKDDREGEKEGEEEERKASAAIEEESGAAGAPSIQYGHTSYVRVKTIAERFADILYQMGLSMFADSFQRHRVAPALNKQIAEIAYKQASHYIRQAFDIYENELAPEIYCPKILAGLKQLAKRQIMQLEYVDAQKTFEEMLKLFLEVKFTTMDELAVVYTLYGEMLMEKKDYFHASLMFQMAVDNYRDLDLDQIDLDKDEDEDEEEEDEGRWSEKEIEEGEEKKEGEATTLPDKQQQQKGKKIPKVARLVAHNLCSKAKALLANEDYEGAQECAELALNLLMQEEKKLSPPSALLAADPLAIARKPLIPAITNIASTTIRDDDAENDDEEEDDDPEAGRARGGGALAVLDEEAGNPQQAAITAAKNYQAEDEVVNSPIILYHCPEIGVQTYVVLALIHYHYDEFEDTDAYYEKALQLLHLRDGGDDEEVGEEEQELRAEEETLELVKVYHNRGILMHTMGEKTKAKEFLEQALVILFRRHGNAFYQLASTLEALHDLLVDNNEEEEAESIEKYAIELEQRIDKLSYAKRERVAALQRELTGLGLLEVEHEKKQGLMMAGGKRKQRHRGLVEKVTKQVYSMSHRLVQYAKIMNQIDQQQYLHQQEQQKQQPDLSSSSAAGPRHEEVLTESGKIRAAANTGMALMSVGLASVSLDTNSGKSMMSTSPRLAGGLASLPLPTAATLGILVEENKSETSSIHGDAQPAHVANQLGNNTSNAANNTSNYAQRYEMMMQNVFQDSSLFQRYVVQPDAVGGGGGLSDLNTAKKKDRLMKKKMAAAALGLDEREVDVDGVEEDDDDDDIEGGGEEEEEDEEDDLEMKGNGRGGRGGGRINDYNLDDEMEAGTTSTASSSNATKNSQRRLRRIGGTEEGGGRGGGRRKVVGGKPGAALQQHAGRTAGATEEDELPSGNSCVIA